MDWTETRQRLIDCGIAAERLPDEWQPGIDLSGADLSGADLREANLRVADLREANLRGANLSWADLSWADGPFTVGYFGQHHAVAAGGFISIGCEYHSYEWWIENYEACGREHRYTDAEIADYGAWIRLAVARQQRIEQPEGAA